jgi:hypothetical protein
MELTKNADYKTKALVRRCDSVIEQGDAEVMP